MKHILQVGTIFEFYPYYCPSRLIISIVNYMKEPATIPNGLYQCKQTSLDTNSCWVLHNTVTSIILGYSRDIITIMLRQQLLTYWCNRRTHLHFTPRHTQVVNLLHAAIRHIYYVLKWKMPMHGCYPTPAKRGDSCLLRFRHGPIHPSLDNLMSLASARPAILTPGLVRTSYQHSTPTDATTEHTINYTH